MRSLGFFLDRLHDRYHTRSLLETDPLEFVHHYSDPHDQETVALAAALLAYGNVKQIRRSVADLLTRMGDSPATFVRKLSKPDQGRTALAGFVHRFNTGDDLALLFWLLSRSWREHGSLGAHFLAGLDPKDADIGPALDRLISDWRRWLREDRISSPGIGYLLNTPLDGSCCKRWCMFLRWMGRKDELDPGLWAYGGPLAPKGKGLDPNQLVLPIDTHTGRISQYLGLTTRKSLGWKAAQEITSALKRWDPKDPTRYDFALARLGILDLCQRKYRREICSQCQLVSVCKFARSRGKST